MERPTLWYFPYDPKGYQAVKALKKQGFIYWHQGNHKYRIGDLLYLYASSPLQLIVCKAEITEVNVPYSIGMDRDAFFATEKKRENTEGMVCVRVEPIVFNKSNIRPNYNDLKNIGVRCFQSPSKLSDEMADAIEALFDLEGSAPVRPTVKEEVVEIPYTVGDIVMHKSFGLGTVFEIGNDYFMVEFSDKERKIHCSAISKGYISKVEE